jgi:hypothetical protein
MRKQYYFRPSHRGLLAWDVDRLVVLTSNFPRHHISLTRICELDEPFCGEEESPTWRSLLGHLELVDAADLSYPIILAADGSVMDGMHRVTKALREGRQDIEAVQFTVDPEPDYIGRRPEDLPY